MKYLLFDENAISTYVSESHLQSVEYQDGLNFIHHLRGEKQSEIFYNTAIEYEKDGILFVGKRKQSSSPTDIDKRIFCIDLTSCALLSEETNPARLMTVIQRAFRLTLKIWNRYPFSASERINGTKSILFPFSMTDHHRLVIERSNQIPRLESRGITFPLLAYKYNAEDPGQAADIVDTAILRQAGEAYVERKYDLLRKLEEASSPNSDSNESTPNPLECVEADMRVGRNDFVFWGYEQQLDALTESQRRVVEYDEIDTPIRVDGAAGTGKTISLIMRAYRLLKIHKEQDVPFHIVFFAHSESTSLRNQEVFGLYQDSEYYTDPDSKQTIRFVTLLSFCCQFAHIDKSAIVEDNAEDAKTYQLMLIDEVVKQAYSSNKVKTYQPILSEKICSLFDSKKTNSSTLVNMLQHEFSVQIKGRTDCTIESYLELKSLSNGIPCTTPQEKELVFSLFSDYQAMLQTQGSFDVDDVTIEAISHLNAPIWRRRRKTDGYDYIIVDEMHLFNLNEQSVFHFLSKDSLSKKIPLCFALDYGQAIGDRGDTSQDYISNGALGKVTEQKLCTLFRNSPQIADFCASIAASGTLMFGTSFANPYGNAQYHFVHAEESKMKEPELHMYPNDDTMVSNLSGHLEGLMKSLQCKQKDIAIIAFDSKWLSGAGIQLLEKATGKKLDPIAHTVQPETDHFTIASPYEINGLEFQAVIMLGVDEGRVPQTAGTGDVSQHFIIYSAYNMLYLSASRAKYRVIIMGTDVNGRSSCLQHSIEAKSICVEQHTKMA